MKRTLLIGGLLLACQLLFAGMAGAAKYNSSYDKNLNLNVPLLSVPKTNTADLTFNLQQSVYTNVVNPTGLSYEYYYYWISVNNEPVLAVDPFKVGF
jgi:hypothetical protein